MQAARNGPSSLDGRVTQLPGTQPSGLGIFRGVPHLTYAILSDVWIVSRGWYVRGAEGQRHDGWNIWCR
jgi:hypothetical protein